MYILNTKPFALLFVRSIPLKYKYECKVRFWSKFEALSQGKAAISRTIIRESKHFR
jgi:hypothetical protein